LIAASYEYALRVQPIRGKGQDRAAVFEREDGLLIAVADGAGGTSNGEIAAQAVIDTVEMLRGADAEWSIVLRQLDADRARLDGGQTTAVVVVVDGQGVRGASTGDSEAWLVRDGKALVLTHQQMKKPLLGAGAAPVGFRASDLGAGTLVLASDGLFRYAKPADIVRIASGPDIEAAADQLLDLVRIQPAGNVADDVSLVLCRQLVV
jgi:serine/threonine protein phosphatase PrpC